MTEAANKNLASGLLSGFLGMAGFSGTLAATKVAVERITPLAITSGRIVIAAILSILTLAYIGKLRLPEKRFLLPILWMGIGLAVGFPFFVALALENAPAVHGAVAIGLAPVTTAIFAYFRLGERPPVVFWIACVIGFSSVSYYALDAGGGHLSLADGWLLIALLSVGWAYVEGGRVSSELGGIVTLCWAMLLLTPVSVVVLIWSVQDLQLSTITMGSWIGMVYLGVISMFLASVFWYRGLAVGGVARIGQLNLLVPLLALAWSALLLGEEITGTAISCAVLVFIAMVFCLKSRF